ncbi:MAG: flagellar hook protein FlgE [Synergistaceae bacterium]|jgi:flagellar hook protein FlgE|nr:flagellar hook protein FlgE [Synergistaceae bacterium]
MLRSLYTAVSAVRAHTTYLDVTGNNIANVNTTGFKKDVIQFRDMIYQDVKNASAPNSAIPIGGINPGQVGLGVQIGSIETVHTNGSLQSTGIPTDMAISGDGFFVVKNGGQQLYTRAGNFALDRDGNLVMSGNGYMVQGYKYEYQSDPSNPSIRTLVKSSSLSNVNIPIGQKMEAKATNLVSLRCNLDSTCEELPVTGYTFAQTTPPSAADEALILTDLQATNQWSTKVDLFDSKGTKYTLETVFRKIGVDTGPPIVTGWAYASYMVDKDGIPYDGVSVALDGSINPNLGTKAGVLAFGTDGLLKEVDGVPITAPPVGSPPGPADGVINLVGNFGVFGANDGQAINIDVLGELTEKTIGVPKKDSGLDGVTNYDSPSTTKAYYQDGYTMGELQNFSVGDDGTVTGVYSNGQKQALYQVALATFANQQGLLKVGETCFSETANSGMAMIGAPMEGSAGSIKANTLEMSNVDLSEEFVNLIRAQRGFQANTRVVTTSDQVLEELIAMKR